MIILCRNEEKMLLAKEELQKSVTGQGLMNQTINQTVLVRHSLGLSVNYHFRRSFDWWNFNGLEEL